MSAATSLRAAIVSRGLLILFGVLMIAYAWSDDPYLGGEPGFGRTQQVLLGIGILTIGAALAPHSWRCRILLLLAALSCALLAGELVLRTFFASRFRPPYVADSKYLFKLRAGAHGEFVHDAANGGQRIRYRVNDDGHRGKDLAAPGSKARLVVYGDSFIQAIGTEDDATFCARLEQGLAARIAAPVEVVNAGVAAYGPDQIAIRMAEELPRLEPQLVIVSIFAGNDFGDLERNRLFRLGADGTLSENAWVLSDEIKARFAQNEQEAIFKLALRSLRSGSESDSFLPEWVQGAADRATAVVDFWLRRAAEEHEDFVVRGNNVVTNLNMDHYNADCSVTPSCDSARYRIQLMDAVIGRIRTTAAASGVRLVVMLIPHPMDVCPDYAASRIDPSRYPEYARDNLTRVLAGMCLRHDIPCVDLFETFQGRPAKTVFFLEGDDHWNDAGQKLAAEAVEEFLRTRFLLPRPPR